MTRLTQTHQGEVERFGRTLKKHLARRPTETITELQTVLDDFRDYYTHIRRHGALRRRTPAFAYQLIPKATSGRPDDQNVWRVRYDTIDRDGKTSRAATCFRRQPVDEQDGRRPGVVRQRR